MIAAWFWKSFCLGMSLVIPGLDGCCAAYGLSLYDGLINTKAARRDGWAVHLRMAALGLAAGIFVSCIVLLQFSENRPQLAYAWFSGLALGGAVNVCREIMQSKQRETKQRRIGYAAFAAVIFTVTYRFTGSFGSDRLAVRSLILAVLTALLILFARKFHTLAAYARLGLVGGGAAIMLYGGVWPYMHWTGGRARLVSELLAGSACLIVGMLLEDFLQLPKPAVDRKGRINRNVGRFRTLRNRDRL